MEQKLGHVIGLKKTMLGKWLGLKKVNAIELFFTPLYTDCLFMSKRNFNMYDSVDKVDIEIKPLSSFNDISKRYSDFGVPKNIIGLKI